MQPEDAWGSRWSGCGHPLAHRYMELACEKHSLVILAADLPTIDGLVGLIEEVGEHVVALKTHVDMMEGFTPDGWGRVVSAARDRGLLLFEDRKFADIGRVSATQMAGIYNIRSWADFVTSHSLSGPDIVDGLAASWDEVERVGGVFLLAQMSSRDNLLSAEYSSKTIAIGEASPHVVGYIGNGSSALDIEALRSMVGDGSLIWTPGVNLSAAEGVLGQRYGHPGDAVRAGSDGVIVGSGIHASESAGDAARAYAEATWSALSER